ncbi:hypothetical protein VCRLGP8_1170065 [Vibrio crassostreae]|nr:hypothetical protein VCRLGP8_1170065 [Vibrio crassostreae]CDT16881.1 hypothetical protein VCRLGP7_280065 [Vibrio crassostreae]CDT30558.1 hypothetical protein VCRLGP107_410328 [Vibrio crassostreae]
MFLYILMLNKVDVKTMKLQLFSGSELDCCDSYSRLVFTHRYAHKKKSS